MTREQAIELKAAVGRLMYSNNKDVRDYNALIDFIESALRAVSREQVEKMMGEWIDIDGEKVPVDKYGCPRGRAECSVCGEYLTASDEYPCIGHFCPNCGAPMTDEAVEMVMKRWKEAFSCVGD